jgi:uncharacterized protein (TIGR03435 family)
MPSAPGHRLLVASAVLNALAFGLPMATYVRAQADEAPPQPEIGKELSKVANVSLVREPKRESGVWAKVTKEGLKLTFSCGGMTLSQILENITDMPRSLIKGGGDIPRGIFAAKIIAKDHEEIKAKLFEAMERSFNLRPSLQNRKVKALVLLKGENWPRDGFKFATTEDSAMVTEDDTGNITFDGSEMSGVARKLSEKLRNVVLDETGLKGKFQGNVRIRDGASLTEVEKMLLGHGLQLQAAMREVQVLVVERKGKQRR